MIQLAAFLQKHPDGAADSKALIEQAGRKSGATPGFQANATGNTNSQVIISGDSISARLRPHGLRRADHPSRLPAVRVLPCVLIVLTVVACNVVGERWADRVAGRDR
ncbi:hypothetical protein [Streptomyces sp. NPDC046985]|uniref:hypothetical protein n=1 Tax=Streptomyces sp. NPDC046985 TaxID=3155377 RepID=UPI0033E49F97